MRHYETTFILSPDLEETELEQNITRYSNIITAGGGTIEKEDRWGMRRLAYQIRKKTQGYYVQLVHESGPDVPRELERQFLLNENCLRYLTVRAQKPAPKVEAATATDAEAGDVEKPKIEAKEAELEEPKTDQPQTTEGSPTPDSEAGDTETPNA